MLIYKHVFGSSCEMGVKFPFSPGHWDYRSSWSSNIELFKELRQISLFIGQSAVKDTLTYKQQKWLQNPASQYFQSRSPFTESGKVRRDLNALTPSQILREKSFMTPCPSLQSHQAADRPSTCLDNQPNLYIVSHAASYRLEIFSENWEAFPCFKINPSTIGVLYTVYTSYVNNVLVIYITICTAPMYPMYSPSIHCVNNALVY